MVMLVFWMAAVEPKYYDSLITIRTITKGSQLYAKDEAIVCN